MIFYDCPNMLFLDTEDPAANFAIRQGSLSKGIIPAGCAVLGRTIRPPSKLMLPLSEGCWETKP